MSRMFPFCFQIHDTDSGVHLILPANSVRSARMTGLKVMRDHGTPCTCFDFIRSLLMSLFVIFCSGSLRAYECLFQIR